MKFKLIFVIIGVFLFSSLSLSILEFRKNLHLKRNLAKKQAELKTARHAYDHLEDLKRELHQQEKREEELNRILPENEKEPIELIKRITSNLSQFRLRNVEFSLEKEEGPMTMEYQEGAFSTEEMAGTPHPQAGTTISASLQEEVQPLSFKMSFECEFLDLISFLDWLLNQERLVSIEDMSIKREDKILPRQKITLQLSAYTYSTNP